MRPLVQGLPLLRFRIRAQFPRDPNLSSINHIHHPHFHPLLASPSCSYSHSSLVGLRVIIHLVPSSHLLISRTQVKRCLSRLSLSTPTTTTRIRKEEDKNTLAMGKQEEALLQEHPIINGGGGRFWNMKRNRALSLALFSTASGLLLVMAYLAMDSPCSAGSSPRRDLNDLMFVLTPDAAYWKQVGEDNAQRDLELFDTIAADMASGSGDHGPLSAQLLLLQGQITTAGDNNRQLIPQIIDVITRINGFLEGDHPSALSKFGLKALIWYVDGKRDNKSFYLLDGAALWSELRVQILKKYLSGETTSKLIQELGEMEKATGDLRDELDAMAQIFVKGIKRIHALSGDIGRNLVELKEIAHHLQEVSGQKDQFLGNTKALEDKAKELVKEWK